MYLCCVVILVKPDYNCHDCELFTKFQYILLHAPPESQFNNKPSFDLLPFVLELSTKNKRPMDLGALLDTCNWCDKWQFSVQTYFIVTYGLAPLQDIWLQSLSDLEFDLLRSLKVKCDSH